MFDYRKKVKLENVKLNKEKYKRMKDRTYQNQEI